MSATLQNAPLVELVAELRWATRAAGQAEGEVQADAEIDRYMDTFAAAVAEGGYLRSERLVPLGAVVAPHQFCYRMKRLDEASTTSLFQVGPGVFSANGVPPYESWNEFTKIVEFGLDRLLAARPSFERSSPITSISLRYIDLFDARLAEGRTVEAFIREVLKLNVSLPEALTRHSPEGATPRPFLQFQIPMAGGVIMNFGVGEGVANGQQGIVMDMSVVTTVETAASVHAIMGALTTAHEAIDASFRALIEPIRHLMPNKEKSA